MKFHVVQIELILSYKRRVKRNEHSEEGVGTRLIASHGAGSGPTRDYLHRATLPHPAGRDHADEQINPDSRKASEADTSALAAINRALRMAGLFCQRA